MDNLRLSCFATIPVGATAEQVQTVPAITEGAITRTYLYNQYQVGQESIPDTAIRKLLSPVSDNSGKETSSADSSEAIKLPNMETATNLFKQIPIYIYLLILLLVAVVIMEIILLHKRRKQKKRRKSR